MLPLPLLLLSGCIDFSASSSSLDCSTDINGAPSVCVEFPGASTVTRKIRSEPPFDCSDIAAATPAPKPSSFGAPEITKRQNIKD